MAYRFNGTTDFVEFAIAPFVGYTAGPLTVAMFLKRNTAGTSQTMVECGTSTLATIKFREVFFADKHSCVSGGGAQGDSAVTSASTSLWYLLASSRPGGSTLPRYHIHNGTSWTHGTMTGTAGNAAAVAGTDRLLVGKFTTIQFLAADLVCVGIKKSNSSDANVITLTPASFADWRAFGFDWLIGFDTSLQSAGVLQDQASPGTGNEIAKTGTTVVSDPPGWAWGAPTPKSGFLAFT